MKSLALALTLLMGFATTAQSETLYVSDRLEIPMRSGKGTGFKIRKMLTSGTQLTVSEVDTKGGYTKVRTPGGTDGWVLSRYLMKAPAARNKIAENEKRMATMEMENRKVNSSFSNINKARGEAEQARDQLTKENRRLAQELEEIQRTASSALAIDAENRDLKSKIVAYERQAQTLEQENQGLKDRTARDWFMVGAAVVILGMIIGLIIPRIRWRKKSSWDTL